MWLKFSVADLKHYEADPDPSLSLMQILIRIWIRLGSSPDPPRLHFESPRLQCERPRPSIHCKKGYRFSRLPN
jgi:hypothetical protein